ncbi:hypothetical protein CK203_021738 [Vitis vinifera]|uniref:Reverse transcriptase domain-containing protein n=1 Tax=Vitis vinifera TaxID=29760 RepID=A0A438J4U7_VITVI|nr:hypothetical protein CK203_021738 [Vitis vinifera]
MDVMSKMGFGHRWINWMKWCCSTTTFSILINGSPSGFFRSSRGLRQGDPLSPIFSFLPWKLLANCCLVQEMRALFWFQSGRKRKRGVVRVPSLVILVGEGIPMETLETVLGCKIGSLPTSYLGLPLGAPYKSTRVWDAVEKRFRKRLSLWKRQYLSKGDHLALLKNTFSSLPTYFLSLFVISKRVCARLEKIQRDFLWAVEP